MDEGIKSYIAAQLKAGFTTKQIYDALIQSGWTSAGIQAALSPQTAEETAESFSPRICWDPLTGEIPAEQIAAVEAEQEELVQNRLRGFTSTKVKLFAYGALAVSLVIATILVWTGVFGSALQSLGLLMLAFTVGALLYTLLPVLQLSRDRRELIYCQAARQAGMFYLPADTVGRSGKIEELYQTDLPQDARSAYLLSQVWSKPGTSPNFWLGIWEANVGQSNTTKIVHKTLLAAPLPTTAKPNIVIRKQSLTNELEEKAEHQTSLESLSFDKLFHVDVLGQTQSNIALFEAVNPEMQDDLVTAAADFPIEAITRSQGVVYAVLSQNYLGLHHYLHGPKLLVTSSQVNQARSRLNAITGLAHTLVKTLS